MRIPTYIDSVCLGCGDKEAKHHAKGLCKSCFMKQWYLDRKKATAQKNNKKKMTDMQNIGIDKLRLVKMKEARKTGMAYKEIGRLFGVSPSRVGQILSTPQA